jgi:tetratricopeptide (TPR) repeat protein
MPSGAEPSVSDPAAALRAEGRYGEAADLLEREIERSELEGRPRRLALARLARGVVAHDLGDLARSAELLGAARRGLLAGQQPEAVGVCSFDLALVHHDLGELDDAVERLVEARAIFESVGRTFDVASCNQNLGVVFHAMGRDAEAGSRLLAARAAFAADGHADDVAECDHNLAQLQPAPTAAGTGPVRRWAGGFSLAPG